MIFELKNIGSIREAKVEMGNLTVICGKNNTGKTYITYSVYGFLKEWRDIIDEINFSFITDDLINQFIEKNQIEINLGVVINELSTLLSDICEKYSQKLSKIFNSNPSEFENSKFNYIISKKISNKYLKQIADDTSSIIVFEGSKNDESDIFIITKKHKKAVVNDLKPVIKMFLLDFLILGDIDDIFIASAERTGVQLFQKEIDRNRNELVDILRKTKNLDLLEKNTARFAMPIEDNIDFARDLENVTKSNSFLKKKYPETIKYIEQMLGITYQVKDGNMVIVDKKSKKTIPNYMASTSVRSLVNLHLWLKHKAEESDLLMIDEPEINLHPENQIKLARLFVKLANAGIKVWITTHSDYIIKELNNLLMLSNDFPDKAQVMKKLGYDESDILKKEDLRAYIAKNGTVKLIEVDEYGMTESVFDETINEINERASTLVESINQK